MGQSTIVTNIGINYFLTLFFKTIAKSGAVVLNNLGHVLVQNSAINLVFAVNFSSFRY